MNFGGQLVLQFEAGQSLEQYDRFTHIEESIELSPRHSKFAKLDGHDMGMGEFNIFIDTDDPKATLIELADLIDKISPCISFRAGYRKFEEEQYTVLWPPSLESFRIA